MHNRPKRLPSALRGFHPRIHAPPNRARRLCLSSSIVGLSSTSSSPEPSDSVMLPPTLPPSGPPPFASARLAATARRNSSSSLNATRPGVYAPVPRGLADPDLAQASRQRTLDPDVALVEDPEPPSPPVPDPVPFPLPLTRRLAAIAAAI